MIAINTNTGSLYARQAMSLNNRGYEAAMEQLSTGKQLNKASDNVAGMAISTGLASQIKALNQAVRNANDGLSVLATADNSLVQIANMLQRMRDLSSQSVGSANTTQDRDALNHEFQQLKTQISKVSSTTQWNGIDILNGVVGSEWEGNFNFQVGSNPDQAVGVQILNLEQTPAIDVTGGNNLDKTFRFNTGVTVGGWQEATDDLFPSSFSAFASDGLINNGEYTRASGATISLKINGVEVASALIDTTAVDAIGGPPGTNQWYFDPSATPGADGKIHPTGVELSTTMMERLRDAFNDPQNNGSSSGRLFDGVFLKAAFDATTHTLKVGYATRDGGQSVITPLADGSLSKVTGPFGTDGLTAGDDNFAVSFGGLDGWAHAYVSPQQRFDLTVLDAGNSTSKTAQDQLDRWVSLSFSNGRGPSKEEPIRFQISQADIDAIDGGPALSKTVADRFNGLLATYKAANPSANLTTINSTAEAGVLVVDWSDAHPDGFKASMMIEPSLPLSTSTLTTSEDASYALANVDNALEKLNFQRAKIGVAMGALQSKSESLGTQSVKTQEARSRIEDTEYALATSNFAKRSIIQQAASAMLAQANQSPELVLQLLR